MWDVYAKNSIGLLLLFKIFFIYYFFKNLQPMFAKLNGRSVTLVTLVISAGAATPCDERTYGVVCSPCGPAVFVIFLLSQEINLIIL